MSVGDNVLVKMGGGQCPGGTMSRGDNVRGDNVQGNNVRGTMFRGDNVRSPAPHLALSIPNELEMAYQLRYCLPDPTYAHLGIWLEECVGLAHHMWQEDLALALVANLSLRAALIV